MKACCLSCVMWQWSSRILVSTRHLHWQILLCWQRCNFWWVCNWSNGNSILPSEEVAPLPWCPRTGPTTVERSTHILAWRLNELPLCTTSTAAHWRCWSHGGVLHRLVARSYHCSRCWEFCAERTPDWRLVLWCSDGRWTQLSNCGTGTGRRPNTFNRLMLCGRWDQYRATYSYWTHRRCIRHRMWHRYVTTNDRSHDWMNRGTWRRQYSKWRCHDWADLARCCDCSRSWWQYSSSIINSGNNTSTTDITINRWTRLWHMYTNITASWLSWQLRTVLGWIFTINYTGSLTKTWSTNITRAICSCFMVFFTHANHLSGSFC